MFNIGAFYYPKGRPAIECRQYPRCLPFCFVGLFSAILQSSARSIALPIDQLKFSYHVLDSTTDSDRSIQSSNDIADGVIIDGIYLDGAQWDEHRHQMIDCTDQRRTHRLPPLLCKLIPVGTPQVARSSARLFIGRRTTTISVRRTSTNAHCTEQHYERSVPATPQSIWSIRSRYPVRKLNPSGRCDRLRAF